LREKGDVTCPETWGGYGIMPHYFEFWQGQPGRLHDRIIYEKSHSRSWEQFRLAP
jgi:pyridoxamine 5'-phosphate oxidase